MAAQQYFDAEYLGRRRFPDNKSARVNIFNRSSVVLASLLDLIASNYPQDENTNLSILFRALSRESGRMRMDIDLINNDKVYTDTRIEYLQQILGERLFLNERIAPANYSDESFREYLIAIKDAYLVGSKKSNIEQIASRFTGLEVRLRELYLEARKPFSAYGVHDTHKMIVEVFVDEIFRSGKNLNQILGDLDFFVNLIRPAHVLYDTNLIWRETINVNKVYDLIYGDTGGGCVPVYDFSLFTDPVVLAFQVLVQTGSDGATGRIDSIHHDDRIFFLADGTRVITEPGVEGTKIFSPNGRRIRFEDLRVGNWVKLTSIPVPGRFKWWWIPPQLDINDYSQFYRYNYRRPIVQEFVKKIMDTQGRFPQQIKTTPTTVCDRWVQDLMWPQYEDLRKNCDAGSDSSASHTITLAEKMWAPRFSFPWVSYDPDNPALFGSNYSYAIPNTPLTDGSGGPATPSDLTVTFDGTALVSAVDTVDASTGATLVTDSTSYWDASVGRSPVIAETLTLDYEYLKDGTDAAAATEFVFGISHWQMPSAPIVNGDSSGTLADTTDVRVSVDGTYIQNAVTSIRPILGHVTINDQTGFWNDSTLGRIPQIGDEISFDYIHGSGRLYTILMDDVERTLDTYTGQEGFVLDVSDSSANWETDAVQKDDPAQIGYRYRAYYLQHSSVLNSPDTLRLNNYQKPAQRASLANQQDSLNHFNLFWSPEFLDDTSLIIKLDDQYLENGLDPVLKLYAGTPPYQKTFSYHPGLVYNRKLKDIRQHRHPLIYSDLLLKEFDEDGDNVNLSSICDNDGMSFKTRIGEEIPPLEECDPWILTDSVDVDLVEVSIPADLESVPNLRVKSKRLRDNFILREMGDSGVATVSYETNTPLNTQQNVFYMPETVEYETVEYGWVDYPALPLMKDRYTFADSSDVSVKIDGTSVPGIVAAVDPMAGKVTLNDPPTLPTIDNFTLTAQNVAAGEVFLSAFPADSTAVTMSVNGNPKVNGVDFYVLDQTLYWLGGPLDGVLVAGDQLQVTYNANRLINTDVSFTYKIPSSQDVEVINLDNSRILDDEYVFAGLCPDPVPIESGMSFEEYYGFLSDYSEGIRVRYFNKDTYQIEDHMFSGPVFELYDPHDDELSSPDSFPNALVRVKNPIHSGNPYKFKTDYGFIEDPVVRMKKKVFKELLPDRTFRTLEITEMAAL